MRTLRTAIAAAVLLLRLAAAEAALVDVCAGPDRLDAASQDRMLRFSAVVKNELERSNHRLALIARSGLDLRRFGVRYTHAGISLRDSGRTPWSVRQLYYACDQDRPRIFDQGISGFLFGLDDPAGGFISLVLLPAAAEADLERSARDDRLALQLLGSRYSPNAYPYGDHYQNCNQWLAELLAAAWSRPEANRPMPRRAAQDWLHAHGYRPARFDFAFPPPRWLSAVVPLARVDDHPAEDLDQMQLQVSLPSSIEAFVRYRHPQAERIELCRSGERIVVRRGWTPLSDECRPEAGDQVVMLD